jgi:putative transcriptional regulator
MPDGSTQPLEDRTDWARVMAMTEEEIELNALSDPDSDPWTAEELAAMGAGDAPKLIRLKLNLTQEEFAARFAIPLGTLRDWERGARRPTGAARTLLRVIAKEPEAVLRALAS